MEAMTQPEGGPARGKTEACGFRQLLDRRVYEGTSQSLWTIHLITTSKEK